MAKDADIKTNGKETENDYTPQDIRHILVQANFHFWGEVVDWLQKNGATDTELTPQKVNLIMRDFRKLSDEGTEFTTNPEEAESLAKDTREK
jgi:isopropylmalate/homocitrate/citramalate synthase